jgi:hypothetical protein
MNEHVSETWLTWFSWIFAVGLIVWLVAAAVLGVPHGPGHSIESLTPVQTIHDISFPVWIGSLAGIAGLLAVRAFYSLSGPGERAS